VERRGRALRPLTGIPEGRVRQICAEAVLGGPETRADKGFRGRSKASGAMVRGLDGGLESVRAGQPESPRRRRVGNGSEMLTN